MRINRKWGEKMPRGAGGYGYVPGEALLAGAGRVQRREVRALLPGVEGNEAEQD